MKSYCIRPIPLTIGGVSLINKTYRQSFGGRTIPSSTLVWYIEGAKDRILIDSGTSKELFDAHGLKGGRHIQTIDEGLDKIGIRPEDINIVIQTHLHADHVSFAHKFTKAKFIVQKAELDFAMNPHPMFNTRPELFADLDMEVVENDYELDDGIRLLFTPGHTPGGQSVAINTNSGRAIVDCLCGCDENYYPGDLPKKPPVIAPAIHTDLYQAYNSLLRIKSLANIIIPQHEARFAFIDRVP